MYQPHQLSFCHTSKFSGVGVNGGELTEKGQILRTTLHTIKVSPQNSFGKTLLRLVRRTAVRELLSHLMPSERYPFVPFLRMKSQMGQTKNRSSKNCIKKTAGIMHYDFV